MPHLRPLDFDNPAECAAHEQASDCYQAAYRNATYLNAIAGHSVAYANALIDEAMAICGSPIYGRSRRRWGPVARGFLALFACTLCGKVFRPEEAITITFARGTITKAHTTCLAQKTAPGASSAVLGHPEEGA